MRRSQPKRDWSDSLAKLEAEGVCRVCGSGRELEQAHVAGRRYDKPRPGRSTLWVNPDSVVPLCRRDHQAFDHGTLDLLPYLTTAEQARAVLDLGSIETARIKLSPSDYRQVAA